MSEQIREQVSAFLDGELPNSETELLLKRLTRDPELRESFGRYALIGEAVRGGSLRLTAQGFPSRVNHAIDGEPVPAIGQAARSPVPRWWRPFAGAAVAAGVAAIAVVALQQRADAPGLQARGPATARNAAPQTARAVPIAPLAQNAAMNPATREPISYTVPTASSTAPSSMAPGQLTNYVIAHSRYSSGLDQRGVLADMLIEAEEQQPAAGEAATHVAP
jgi:sigma-E factor negative regulatory protein RseA